MRDLRGASPGFLSAWAKPTVVAKLTLFLAVDPGWLRNGSELTLSVPDFTSSKLGPGENETPRAEETRWTVTTSGSRTGQIQ